MVWSGSLAPHFVHNDYVTAEITYTTAHECHRYLLCHVLYTHVSFPEKAAALLLHHSFVRWVSREKRALWYGSSISQETITYLQFVQLFASSSSLLAFTFPNLGSTNTVHSVNSKIVGIMDRVSETHSNINYAGDLNTPANWKLDSCFLILTFRLPLTTHLARKGGGMGEYVCHVRSLCCN